MRCVARSPTAATAAATAAAATAAAAPARAPWQCSACPADPKHIHIHIHMHPVQMYEHMHMRGRSYVYKYSLAPRHSQVSQDLLLSKYSVLLIDEAHERGVNIDLLLGILSRVVKMRRDRARAAEPHLRPPSPPVRALQPRSPTCGPRLPPCVRFSRLWRGVRCTCIRPPTNVGRTLLVAQGSRAPARTEAVARPKWRDL